MMSKHTELSSRDRGSLMRPSIMLLLPLLAMISLATGCSKSTQEYAEDLTGGNVDRGKSAIRALGCQTCHTIPGIPGGEAVVGPPLKGVGGRVYIAGVLENNSDNLVTWIVSPQQVSPQSAMPDTGISPQEAKDLAAYLYAH